MKNVDSLTFRKSSKMALDKAIVGLQVQNCYLDIWNEITKIVKKEYDINMNRIGPIVITMLQKQITLAKEITEKIKKDDRIRDYANECGFPTKSVYYPGDDPERTIDSIIFLLVFRSLMGVSHEITKPRFKTFMQNGVSDDVMKKMFQINGHTINETEEYMESIIDEMVRKINKKKK